jgi:O-antigen ligase
VTQVLSLNSSSRVKTIDRLPSSGRFLPVFLFLVFHVILASLAQRIPALSTLHALMSLSIGLIFTVFGKRIERVFYITAYLTGAEVLWRATNAQVFWEFSKYSIILILILATLKFKKNFPLDWKPILYFLALTPSILLIPGFDRQVISFNLSGPLLLAVSTLFFARLDISWGNLKNMFIALIAPIVGLASLAVADLITNQNIFFINESLRATSIDFGPNQVSAILGLGALSTFLCFNTQRQRILVRILMILLTIWLLAQSVLTFSRGGFWTAVFSIAIATILFLNEKRFRTSSFLAALLSIIVGYFLVLPVLSDITGGMVETRFSDIYLTGRDLIVKADLVAFQAHPLLGVGLGQSNQYHEIYFRYASSHTEYSRILAEHGLLGIVSLLVLLWIVLERFFFHQNATSKPYAGSLTLWTLLYMTHSAMRLAAPSFIFGLGSAHFILDESSEEKDTP